MSRAIKPNTIRHHQRLPLSLLHGHWHFNGSMCTQRVNFSTCWASSHVENPEGAWTSPTPAWFKGNVSLFFFSPRRSTLWASEQVSHWVRVNKLIVINNKSINKLPTQVVPNWFGLRTHIFVPHQEVVPQVYSTKWENDWLTVVMFPIFSPTASMAPWHPDLWYYIPRTTREASIPSVILF